ncbi:carbohydrate ABC transporter permease [Ktedonospora formicarum]|uniref:ABC transporter permease n=1 Tax=Ktedonospora formicarum TaxID=2778364 RepID=A0A8J3MYJ4_9CHLR|nr:sugar ABC transporter permease [Ktedonospora formicarum]GHO51011.1 ABC transporter permease [Ktedonospora formicarum]
MVHVPSKPVNDMIEKSGREVKQSRGFKLSGEGKEHLTGYLFLLPWFAGLILLTIGPMISSLYLSFTNFDLLSQPQWVGLQNYLAMFQDPRWLSSVKVTLIYVFVSVPLKMLFALGLALLLNRGLRGLAIYRAIYYVPSLLGGSVAIAILWRQIFNTDGLINQVLGLIGIKSSISWIASPNYALGTLIILAIWQFGSPMIIFLAGIKQISPEYYEAASTDGAGALRRFWHITLPLLTPIIFFNMILQMVGAFQAFTPAFIVSGGNGGPIDSTLFYTLYIYLEGFGNRHMGYASAMAWVLLIAIALFSALAFLTSRYWVFYQDERKN